MKKLISILLAIIMALSVCVTAFAVSDTTDIRAAEEIRLDNYKNGEEIIVGVDSPEYYKVYVNGLHNEANPVLTVSVENEDIASAKIADDKNICITGNKTGKTTLTVTDADGASGEFTVRVIPKGINSLRLTFKNIGDNLSVDFLFSGMLLLGGIFGLFAPVVRIFSK